MMVAEFGDILADKMEDGYNFISIQVWDTTDPYALYSSDPFTLRIMTLNYPRAYRTSPVEIISLGYPNYDDTAFQMIQRG